MPAATVERIRSGYHPVALEGLASDQPLSFPVYLRTGERTWVLYRDVEASIDAEQLGRLRSEGIEHLFIRDESRSAYHRRVEGQLDMVLKDRSLTVEARVEVLHGVAVEVAGDLLQEPGRANLDRSERFLIATSGWMLREPGAFRALRCVLRAGPEMAHHSLAVGFLSMGLARNALGADPGLLTHAGLAGLLHDIGRVGHAGGDSDVLHAERGAELLRRLGVASDVCGAVRHHHERHDGSGHPDGLRGREIPELARIVGLVDTFEKVYSSQQPRVGVFDALRIMAEAYRGCFDPELAQEFVEVFRAPPTRE